jgi:hypothetical protein
MYAATASRSLRPGCGLVACLMGYKKKLLFGFSQFVPFFSELLL